LGENLEKKTTNFLAKRSNSFGVPELKDNKPYQILSGNNL
jgi:hypothetical protein